MGREIDWASAEVRNGTLTVAMAEPEDDEEAQSPDGWSDYVSGVLDRLGRGGSGWGSIDVGDERIEVESVKPGAESDLRHLLESAVLQANAHFEREGESESDEDDDGPESEDDKRMTEAFRAFGEGGP